MATAKYVEVREQNNKLGIFLQAFFFPHDTYCSWY